MENYLFRGKRVDNDEWVYGYYLYVEERNKHYILTGKLQNYQVDCTHPTLTVLGFEWFEVKEETVGQYIGSKDKNGKGIYDGDIIQGFLSYTKEDRAFIVYEKESMGFVPTPAFDEMSGGFFEIQDSKDIEVIGNVYDNPELLEKVK